MQKIDKTDLRIILELMKNPRTSDRQLAIALHVSQPTVSRRIQRMEKEGLLEYDVIPDLQRLGFHILAFTLGNWDHSNYPDTKVANMRDFIAKHPSIIFVSTGEASGFDRIGISVHKDYSEYERLLEEYRRDWGEYFKNLTSFIISLDSDSILKNLSFKALVNAVSQERTS